MPVPQPRSATVFRGGTRNRVNGLPERVDDVWPVRVKKQLIVMRRLTAPVLPPGYRCFFLAKDEIKLPRVENRCKLAHLRRSANEFRAFYQDSAIAEHRLNMIQFNSFRLTFFRSSRLGS